MKIIEILDINNKKYPETLRKIPNPPIKLYCEGNIELLQNNIISIVGSRKCTENGIKLTKYFAENLAKQNITIASGMAVRNRHSSTFANFTCKWKNNSSTTKWARTYLP